MARKFQGLKITIDPKNDHRARIEAAIYNADQKDTVLGSIIRFITHNNLEADFHEALGDAIREMVPADIELTIDDPEAVEKIKKMLDELKEEEKPGEYMA